MAETYHQIIKKEFQVSNAKMSKRRDTNKFGDEKIFILTGEHE